MNNRTIKFRAWDKQESKWLFGYEYPSLGGFSMFGEVMLMGEYHSLLNNYAANKRLDDIILMQSTGLTDRNGKEIFESDILSLDTVADLDQDCPVTVIGYVIYNEVRGYQAKNIKIINKEYLTKWSVHFGRVIEGVWIHTISFGESEVIGNIYTNPDLLKANPASL